MWSRAYLYSTTHMILTNKDLMWRGSIQGHKQADVGGSYHLYSKTTQHHTTADQNAILRKLVNLTIMSQANLTLMIAKS